MHTVVPSCRRITRSRSQPPLLTTIVKAKGQAELQQPHLQKWEVVYPTGVNVRSAKDSSAPAYGFKLAGAVMLGRQEGNWVALFSEPGFMMIATGPKELLRQVSSEACVEYEYVDGTVPCSLRFEVLNGKLIQTIKLLQQKNEITHLSWQPVESGGMIIDQSGNSWLVPGHWVNGLKALADRARVPNNLPRLLTAHVATPRDRVAGVHIGRCIESELDRRVLDTTSKSVADHVLKPNDGVPLPSPQGLRSSSIATSGPMQNQRSSDVNAYRSVSMTSTHELGGASADMSGDVEPPSQVASDSRYVDLDELGSATDDADSSTSGAASSTWTCFRKSRKPVTSPKRHQDLNGSTMKGNLSEGSQQGDGFVSPEPLISACYSARLSAANDLAKIARTPSPGPRAVSRVTRASSPCAHSPSANELQVLTDAYSRLVGHSPLLPNIHRHSAPT